MSEAFYSIRPVSDFRDLLVQSAKLFFDRPAFRLKNKAGEYYDVLYPQFLRDVKSLGSVLYSMGLAGEKVAVIGRNSYQWATTYFAVTCGLGVIVPIDKELPSYDIANILKVSGTKAILYDEKCVEKVREALRSLDEEILEISFDPSEDSKAVNYNDLMEEGYKLLDEGYSDYTNAVIDPKKMSNLLFTSGTTGMAKGVMLSQYNICSDITLLSGVVKINSDDRLLSVLPLHHTYESMAMIVALYSGACIAYSESLLRVVREMQEIEPTVFVTVPLMLEKIHDRILRTAEKKRGGKFALSFGKALTNATSALGMNINDRVFAEIKKNFGGKLRLIITGAAAISPEIVKDFHSFGIPIYLGYGLTECSPLVIGNNDRLMLNDSVGVPLPEVEAKIINPDFSGVGEICVRGPMVMLGYYNDPESTREVLDEDGWFHTGDLGTVDDKGHFRITGRIKNVIVTKNGKNIYPEEVEYYLNKNPFIAESIVVGEDEDDETFVTAKVFPNVEAITKKLKQTSISSEDISRVVGDVIREVNKKLPSYKNIKRTVIRESAFVKTTTQKIKRFADHDEEKK